MKITFIGTGNSGSKTRANPSVLIDDLLIDIGCGTVKQLGNLNIETKGIKYVLISHFHSDHFADIIHLLVARYFRNENKNLIRILGPIGLEKTIRDFITLTQDNVMLLNNTEIIDLKENEELELDEFKITPLSLVHGNVKSIYGYIIEKDNKKIGYACDTTVCDNFEEICKNVDYLFGDVNGITTTPMHMGLADFTEYAKKYKNCKFYAIHRGDYEDRNEYVNFPEDGDILII